MAQPYIPPCQTSRITAIDCPREAGHEPDRRTRRIILTACILASSMAFIDGSALTVALPALNSELGGNLSAVQWVLNGYVLALAAFAMIGGALADTYGRARMLIAGSIAFAAASAACALSPDTDMLIASRVAQGLAAAIVTPASLALIGETFPKDERTRAIGIWAGVSALAAAGGPILGGWLTENFSWRGIFWINLPIAAMSIGLLTISKRPAITNSKPFDIIGALVLAAALASFAFALSALSPGEVQTAPGTEQGSSGKSLAGFGIGLLLMIGFLIQERRTPSPMVPTGVFRSVSFSGLNAATVFIYAGLSIMFFLLPFRLVDNLGMTPTEAGLAFLPFTLCVGFLSGFFGNLAGRIGTRPLLTAGPLLAAAGFVLFPLSPGDGIAIAILLPMAIVGLGFAMIVAPLTSEVMNSVDDADEGLASGVNNTASRIAQMLGVALAAIFAAMQNGFETGLWVAATICAAGALIIAMTLPSRRATSEPTENISS